MTDRPTEGHDPSNEDEAPQLDAAAPEETPVDAVAEPVEASDPAAETTVMAPIGDEPEVAVEPEAEPEPAAEPEAEVEPEPEAVVEPAVDPEPAAVPDPEPAVEAPAAETTVLEPAAPEVAATTVIPAVVGDEPAAPAKGKRAPGYESLQGEASSNRGRKVLTGVGIGIVVLAGAYVGGVLWSAERTPATATVSGVDVSGLPRDEAVATLRSAFSDRVDAPIGITIGDLSATIDPALAGLTLDADASIDAITGQSWDPRVLWERLAGSVSVEAVTGVDTAALTTQLEAAEEFVAVAPQDAAIAFASGRAVVTDPVDGSGLDVPGAVEILSAGWLTQEQPISLPVVAIAPELGQGAVDAAMAEIVQPLLSAPVTVNAGDRTTSIDSATLTGLATIVGTDGAFHLEIDAAGLAGVVSTALPDLGSSPQDASFQFVNDAPAIVPSVDGTGLDPAQLAAAVSTAAVETAGRVATAEFTGAEAAFSTADAEALGIKEVIGEFSTPLPGYPDPPRTENLRIGSGRVTGILLKPGETFSLLEVLSPFDAANGYNQSGVVVNGFESKAYGGGLSQLSTTLFNAAFEAGLEDVTHKPHSRWFSRYPEGREATLFEGQVDMQFTNTTDHGVLLQAWVGDDSRVHARVWGTDAFDVSITTGGRYAVRQPSTVYNTRADCIAESGGQTGFTVDVRRVVTRLDGTPEDDHTYTWTYAPWHKVVCGPDPATLPPTPPPATETPAEGQG